MKSLVISTLLLVPFLASALTPSAQGTTPTAEEILARYVEVTGGQAAYDRIENRVTRATQLAQGGTEMASVRVYAEKGEDGGDHKYTIMELTGGAISEAGVIGDVAWNRNPNSPPTLAKGAVRGNVLRQAVFDRLVYWRKAWTAAEYTGTKVIGAEDCHEITLTPKVFDEAEATERGRPAPDVVYFSKATGLLVMGTKRTSGEETVTVAEIHLSNYKKVDGILLPFTTIVIFPGRDDQRVIQAESIQHNLLMMPKQFTPPEEIRKLLDAEKDD